MWQKEVGCQQLLIPHTSSKGQFIDVQILVLFFFFGFRRTAIEEELEILYDAYYEELEQYANHQQSNHGYGVARSLQDGYASMRTDAALVDAYANQILASKNPLDHQDDYDDEDDEEDEEDDDEDDEDDEDYDGDYDDEDLGSR